MDQAPADSPAGRLPAGTPSSFVDGRYQVGKLLGRGRRKQVFLAHDTHLDRQVAFALVRTDDLGPVGRDRIRRELQVTGRLGDHPNIATVYDTGEDDGRVFIVSEYLPGYALADDENITILQDLYALLGDDWVRNGCFNHYLYIGYAAALFKSKTHVAKIDKVKSHHQEFVYRIGKQVITMKNIDQKDAAISE